MSDLPGSEPDAVVARVPTPAVPTVPLGFTRRQLEVVALLAAGCSAAEIAAQLGISPRTVRMHCDALKSKLQVRRSRQIAAAFEWRTGIDPLLDGAGG